jgi:signal transduction histidine kinase
MRKPLKIDSKNIKHVKDISVLFHSLMQITNYNLSKTDFLRSILTKLTEYTGCPMVIISNIEKDKLYFCKLNLNKKPSYHYKIINQNNFNNKNDLQRENISFENMIKYIEPWKKHLKICSQSVRGSLWTGNAKKLIKTYGKEIIDITGSITEDIKDFNSCALIPIETVDGRIGLLQLWNKKANYFTKEQIIFFEHLSEIIGFILLHRSAKIALQERVKELTCLYNISDISSDLTKPLENILRNVVKVLPPAWLYPEVAEARISFSNKCYSTPDFKETPQIQSAEFYVNGKEKGKIEIVYLENMPESDIGPFLNEERDLIETVAKKVRFIIERKYTEIEKTNLEDQLRHADRLALLGKLVASVAHELNEPINNILGFSQLVKKNPSLPKQAAKDIDKIEKSSLYIRNIIKQLLTFARLVPTQNKLINFNDVIKDLLPFLESRCRKEGIELQIRLSENLPAIFADHAQMTQTLLNLAQNAIQALSKGGKLLICTLCTGNDILLIVEDTGIGMNEEIQKQIFLPFFTTKEAGEGTGLGLSVVHGIVNSHGGSIQFRSQAGKGTRFEVRFPVKKKKQATDYEISR